MRRPNKFSAYRLKIYPTDIILQWNYWHLLYSEKWAEHKLKMFFFFPYIFLLSKKKNYWKNPKNFGYVYLTKYLPTTSITTGRDQA